MADLARRTEVGTASGLHTKAFSKPEGTEVVVGDRNLLCRVLLRVRAYHASTRAGLGWLRNRVNLGPDAGSVTVMVTVGQHLPVTLVTEVMSVIPHAVRTGSGAGVSGARAWVGDRASSCAVHSGILDKQS